MATAKYKYYFVPDVKDVWVCDADGARARWLLLNYPNIKGKKQQRIDALKYLRGIESYSISSEQDIKNRNGIPIKREDALALINNYSKELQYYYATPPHN